MSKYNNHQTVERMLAVEQLQQLPLFHRASIPPEYLDIMEHMNVQWYMELYNQAAWRMFDSFGMNEDYYTSQQAGAFALKQFIQYLAEVHVGETVAIRSRFLGRSAKRIHVMHFMINETTGVLASTMEVLAAHADLRIRRTSPFPPHIASKIDTMIAEHEQLGWEPSLSGVIHP
jgi:acyl-CoA thioester hydrolase